MFSKYSLLKNSVVKLCYTLLVYIYNQFTSLKLYEEKKIKFDIFTRKVSIGRSINAYIRTKLRTANAFKIFLMSPCMAVMSQALTPTK
jgi:hypothetical protein